MGRPITQVHMIGDYDSFTQLSNGFPGSVDERKYRSEELGWWRVDGKPEYISPERHATVKVVQDASGRVEVDYDPSHRSFHSQMDWYTYGPIGCYVLFRARSLPNLYEEHDSC